MKTRIVGLSRFVAATSASVMTAVQVRTWNGHTHAENMIRVGESSKQVSEAMEFFNAYTRFMLAVALSIGMIVSILDNYLPG